MSLGPSWQPPRTLSDGRYVLEEEIGRGGVGIVFAVRDTVEETRRAAKILFPQLAGSRGRERFATEAEVLMSIDHPHVVRVFDAGACEDTHWMVMELVQGGTVADRLRKQGALPLPEVVRIGVQILAGLAAVHAAGAVHRDVKPGNVLLDEQGHVKLADFGLVRVLDSNLTATGSRLGTAFFVPPEQRLDPRNVSPRSDLFAVAATLTAMATGRRPPNLALLQVEPTVLDAVPEALRPVVRRGAAYDPADRYASADEMAEDLRAAS